MNLITGATGLLGSHIAEQLHRRGEPIRVLVRRGSDTSFLDTLGVEKVYGDITDKEGLRKACEGVKVVYHAAAKVGDWGKWEEFQRITIDGTVNLLEAASEMGVERFLHISSISVYGYVDGDGVELDETAPLGVNLYRWSYYSKAKVIAEQKVWQWHNEGKIKATIIRPSWLYGPRDRASIPRLINAIRKGKARLVGDGNNFLSLSYAGNVAEAAILAASKEEAIGQAYNACKDGNITLREYMNMIAKQLGAPPVTKTVPYSLAKNIAFILELTGKLTGRKKPPMISRYAIWLMGRRIQFSNEKIKRLGWHPTVDYTEGIKKTVRWFLEEEKKQKQ